MPVLKLVAVSAFAAAVTATAAVADAPASTAEKDQSSLPPIVKQNRPLFGKIATPGISTDEITSIEVLHARVAASPQDAKARYALAHALRLQGQGTQAASQLLEATSLDPSYFIAYHELTLCKPTNEQLDEVTERLCHLRDERPKELMLRVALSEVLEQRGDNYGASRALVDLMYEGGVPPQYRSKVEARIHFLLSKAKDSTTAQSAKAEDGGLDSLPPELPGAGVKRDIAASKQTTSFGNSTLLP